MTPVLQAVGGRGDTTAPDGSNQSSSGLVRKLLLVLALGIIVYLVTNRGDARR